MAEGPDLAAIEAAMNLAGKPSAPPEIKSKAPKDRGIDFDGGLIHTAGHGRTDNVPLNVPSGSYILPADIVSAFGQGNTIAGAHAIHQVLLDAPYHASPGPYGAKSLETKRGDGPPGPSPGGPPAPPPGNPEVTKNAIVPEAYQAQQDTPHFKAGGGANLMRAAGIMLYTKGPRPLVLFLKRGTGGDHAGEWCFPGGKVEPDENTAMAALRETQEESGIALPPQRLRPWSNRRNDGVDFATFAAEVPAPIRPRMDAESTDWRWAPYDDPPRPLHPGCPIALNHLRERLGKTGPQPSRGPMNPNRVPIIAAGGEYVMLPHEAQWVGDGDVNKGHRNLDNLVVDTRNKLRNTLSNLEPPKKD
jgi:8-oxo-dGTP pyrophosphatase MutT (NUDIX family)